MFLFNWCNKDEEYIFSSSIWHEVEERCINSFSKRSEMKYKLVSISFHSTENCKIQSSS